MKTDPIYVGVRVTSGPITVKKRGPCLAGICQAEPLRLSGILRQARNRAPVTTPLVLSL